ncbi:MAG: MaoC family dehydratase N-terminal domain-containing protein [Actinomycetota bacterium]|nr:MaoC family dehydratase N-terminal domain-containing protein [Actinomycetota bacterium]
MAVSPDLAGRTYPPTEPYTVAREKIAEFCAAIGATPADEAPPTFPIVVAFEAMQRLMTDADVGIELHNVVHRDQAFEHRRPVRAGDRLTATLTVESLRQAAGTDLIGTRTEITDADGALVSVARATLAHRATGEPA